MKVLVACEFSGTVRDAFLAQGHDAWSCDLLDTEKPGPHIQTDVRTVLDKDWDLLIAHPPCTHLAVSGARWFKDKLVEQAEALELVQVLLSAPVPKIALENPVSIISSRIRKPDQIIQPWQFGHGETKATCLWLKNLPKLWPTQVVGGREARVHRIPPSADRWRERSRTYQGIADAMAQQWGGMNVDPEEVAKIQEREDERLEREFNARASEKILQSLKPGKKRTGRKIDKLQHWEEAANEREQEDEAAWAGSEDAAVLDGAGAAGEVGEEAAGTSRLRPGVLSESCGEDEVDGAL